MSQLENRLRSAVVLFLGLFIWAAASSAKEPTQNDALLESAMETPRALAGVFLASSRAGKRLLFAGERGHIVYSNDNGDSWQQAHVPVRSTLTSIFFLNDRLGWAAGHDSVILASTDGGETWVKQLDGYQASELVMAAATKRLLSLQEQAEAGGADRAQLQERLEFAEIAMDEAERDLKIGPAKALMDIWFADTSNGLVIGANGYFLRTEDGGASWQDWSDRIGNLDMLHLYKLVDGHDGTVYLAGESGMSYRSTDLGASWELLDLPYGGSLFGGVVRPSDYSAYLFGLSGVVLRSMNHGESWEFVPSNSKSILQNATLDGEDRVVIVGLGGVLLRENLERTEFVPVALGGRSALTGLLVSDDGRLVVAGESGVRVFDTKGGGGDEALKRYESLDFMFHKRDVN